MFSICSASPFISLHSTVWRSSLFLLHRVKADWDELRFGTHHLSPPPHTFHTIKRLCMCVCMCVCVCMCMCLIKLCLANPRCCGCIRIYYNPSITDATSFTFLGPCLKNISGGGIYFPSVPLIGFIPDSDGLEKLLLYTGGGIFT